VQAGEVVVDLMGGFADRADARPFGPDTLAPVVSTGKALAGRLDYGQPVAEVWPEFAHAGKAAVTVEQALSHQAGLSGFPEPMEPALWFDAEAIAAKLAALAPLWPPGSASGYHPGTFLIAGEIFRRVDGCSLGTALREDLAAALGLDIWIGLPDAEHGRVAEVRQPTALPRFGELNAATRAAFLNPLASPNGRQRPRHRPFAGAGRRRPGRRLDGATILSPALIAGMARARICGQDVVLPFDLCWGAGVLRLGPAGDLWAGGRSPSARRLWRLVPVRGPRTEARRCLCDEPPVRRPGGRRPPPPPDRGRLRGPRPGRGLGDGLHLDQAALVPMASTITSSTAGM
jgi:CubicO group peptidase (beta-lactamase class C family)